MTSDIERKFLVKPGDWIASIEQSSLLQQGYISFEPEVRIRIQSNPNKYFLTVLGMRDAAGQRQVFEYLVPELDAQAMLAMCRCQIRKTRHKTSEGFIVDEIADNRRPELLVLAEIKVSSLEQEIILPDWLGAEVTGQPEYTTAWIAQYGIQSYQLCG